MSIRVAIADDDDLVRTGISSILSHDDAIKVPISCASGSELVSAVIATTVDAILLDIRMPGMDGLTALKELRQLGSPTPVAMLTTFRQEALIESAIELGAQGFLLKSDAPHDLIRNVEALAAGGAVFSPRVAHWLISGGRKQFLQDRLEATEKVNVLSEQQRNLLTHLATGASNKEIAAALFLSEGTVKQYLRPLFERLGVENRVQAALIGYQAGLV